MLRQIHQGVILEYSQKVPKEEEIVKYSNGCDLPSLKTQIKKIEEYHSKKREGSKEEAPVASTKKPKSSQPPQERKKNKKNNLRKPYFSKLQDPKNPNRFPGKCFQHGQNLHGIQEQREAENDQTRFPKEVPFYPDVVNTLKDI
ncbi:hypothetical protein O181_012465 [Austropuccinia psidii MF-1]|uniref:Uncharacterized protein n=1 Tax=Austropuccinia psidii MF-1 TaxID=1389203 RepID=A0A9Q3GMZ2_9BASI|nr:hypothetical protein [Austropuccinia psidii MF-1]